MNQIMLELLIKNVIGELEKAGFPDPTQQNICYKIKETDQSIKFRLYTDEQWNTYLAQKSDATKLATKLGFGERPDCVVTYKDTIYYVKLL